MKANIPSKIENHQVVARNSATHRAWALEAASLAEQVLPLFEKEHPDDNRPRQAIEAIRDWAQGRRELGMAEVRKLSLSSHAAAREARTDAVPVKLSPPGMCRLTLRLFRSMRAKPLTRAKRFRV
jgi:hypothetical protein